VITIRFFIRASSLIMICGLLANAAQAGHSDTQISASLDQLTGVWSSEGYGLIVEIHDDSPPTFDRYQFSNAACLLTDSGPLEFFFADLARVLRNADSTRFTHMTSGNITTYAYNRLNELPARCRNGGTGQSQDPLHNFDVFWATLNEQYAFFEQRGVNWSALRKQMRSQLGSESSDEELFDVLVEMATPLCDGHVQLVSEFDDFNGEMNPHCWGELAQTVLEEFGKQSEFTDLFEFYQQVFQPAVLDNIEGGYLRGNFDSAAGGKILWGDLGAGVAYMNVLQMTEYLSPDATPDEDLEVLAAALDEALASLAGKDALVLDVRLNSGGYDHVALDLASRFVHEPRVAFTKKARWDDGFTEKEAYVTRPGDDLQFTGPIVILASDLTASAAENFLLAMRTLPHVTIVGETTVGVHSDVLQRRLPNGWLFTLSNEVYEAPDGAIFEGRGIAPDLEVASLRSAHLGQGIDTGIEAALEVLTSHAMDAGLNGNWWNGPERGGEGFQIEVASDGAGGLTFIATFYTYDTMGNQVFLVAVGPVHGDTAAVDVFITEGGLYGEGLGDAGTEWQWGTGTVTAVSCEALQMSLIPDQEARALGFTNLAYDLVRLTTPAMDCPLSQNKM
jgi:hypothetical protein